MTIEKAEGKPGEAFRNLMALFFVFLLVSRKLPEILEAIIAFEAACVNQMSYLEILRRIKYSDISCSNLVHKRKYT